MCYRSEKVAGRTKDCYGVFAVGRWWEEFSEGGHLLRIAASGRLDEVKLSRVGGGYDASKEKL